MAPFEYQYFPSPYLTNSKRLALDMLSSRDTMMELLTNLPRTQQADILANLDLKCVLRMRETRSLLREALYNRLAKKYPDPTPGLWQNEIRLPKYWSSSLTAIPLYESAAEVL